MIFILQAGLYDIIKKSNIEKINKDTIKYKDNVFLLLREDKEADDIISSYVKEEALIYFARIFFALQLTEPKIHLLIDFPCFTMSELSTAISELRDSLSNNNNIELFQKEFNIEDDKISKDVLDKIYIDCLYVDYTIKDQVLNILENNNFKYIETFKINEFKNSIINNIEYNLYDYLEEVISIIRRIYQIF